MQLTSPTISKVTALALLLSQTLYAENYASLEFLYYDESSDRVSVIAPMLTLNYDIGTDYTIKASILHDSVSGATPAWQPDSTSGASSRDNSGDYRYANQAFDEQRNAASLMLTTRFASRDELSVGVDYSRESDFDGITLSTEYLHYTDSSHNRSLSLGVSYGVNEILSYDYDTGSGASHKEESTALTLQAGITQVLTTQSSLKVDGFAIIDDGYLTNPHANVVRHYGTAQQALLTEHRPSSRTAYGTTLSYITMLGEQTSLKGRYRFYRDDWEITSHTLEADLYYQLTPAITLGAGVRGYTQSEAEFYHASKSYFTDETYASSDERLSDFDAMTYKASIDYRQSETISYNLGGSFYTQPNNDLEAITVTTGIKYHF